jgi:TolB-like protein/DNA-binding SARP family transcriptional activator/Tfp pilus assembly protein PilF
MLRLRAFGGLALERNGVPVEAAAGRRRALAVLVQLAIAGPRGLSRAKLVHRLWPDSDEEKARNVLAQTLHKLKRDVGGEEIIVGAADVRLDETLISSDVGDFERHVLSGSLEEAAKLYAGPFLDGFYISGVDEFERWADEERTRLARLAGETFEALARKAEATLDPAAAVVWWRRLAAIDALNVRATIGLMTTLASMGETAASLRAGAVHQALLDTELGALRDASIDQLMEAIQRGELAPRVTAPLPQLATGVPDDVVPSASISPADLAVQPTVTAPRRRVWYAAGAILASVVILLAYLPTRRGPAILSERAKALPIPAAGSIAVLPFVNLSQVPADEYLSDGVVDELTTALSRVPGLRVAAHTSALAFKGAADDAPRMASALGVQTLLQGSVRRTGGRAHIEVRLVSGTDGVSLMSGAFDWDVGDPIALERNLAAAIADSLRVTMPTLGRASSTRGTADALAHDLYLRGRFEWNKRTPAGLAQAVAYFRQAIARDAGYAASYAGLADALINLSMYEPSADMIEQAERASDRAIAIDPSLGEAHVSRAMIRDIHGDARAADREYELAVALEPSYAPAHHWHAFELEARGHHAEAIEEMRTAYALDPLSASIGNAYGAFLYFDHDWTHAIDVLQRALRRAPEPLPIVLNLAAVLSASGRDSMALAALTRLPGEDLARFEAQAAMAIAHWHLGDRDSAQAIIRRLTRSGTTRANAMAMANVYAQIGEPDSAFAVLARVDWRRDEVLNLRADPVLDPIRGDRRFAALMSRVTSR